MQNKTAIRPWTFTAISWNWRLCISAAHSFNLLKNSSLKLVLFHLRLPPLLRAEKYTKWFCGYKNNHVRTTAAITAIPILERFLRCFSSASDRSRFGSLIVPTAKITTAETATHPMQTQGYDLINDATGIVETAVSTEAAKQPAVVLQCKPSELILIRINVIRKTATSTGALKTNAKSRWKNWKSYK